LAGAIAISGRTSARAATAAEEWQPIDPADLAMKSEPLAPAAPAIYLYREIISDNAAGYTYFYYRIKVLTEEGRKWGNVEIPYYGGGSQIQSIDGRTIQPDGTIVPWKGKPLDQTVLRAHGLKVHEKVFSMPDVQIGSVVEYRYRVETGFVFRTTWHASADLFTRYLHCILRRSPDPYLMLMQAQHIPPEMAPTLGTDGLVHFDAHDLAGIVPEDFMPPVEMFEGKVDFFYTIGQITQPDPYWKFVGKAWNEATEKFVARDSSVRDEAEKVAPASDLPEVRLRKLYARAQQIRNLSHELEKTTQEMKTEKLKDIKSAADVLKKGYGYDTDVNLFFLALARASGFAASSVRVSDRAEHFFNPKILDQEQLDSDVVLVTLNGQDVYLDPACAHCGFAQLPWPETETQGLKLDAQGGSFVTTPALKSSDAVIERTATLQMDDDGWLHGKLAVSFSGQQAMGLRQNADNQDGADRKKAVTDEVAAWLPANATLTLTNQPDWAGSDSPLRAEFDVRMKPVGAMAGHVVLISENCFADYDLPRFDHAVRTYPIDFDYPWEMRDNVSLALPAGLEAGELPAPVDRSTQFGTYHLSCDKQPGGLNFQRAVTLSAASFGLEYYGQLRAYFAAARIADQQQVMLRVAATRGVPAHP
jgi:hypothetical protein